VLIGCVVELKAGQLMPWISLLVSAVLEAVWATALGRIVDLAEVSFCDSTGIGAIVRARNAAAVEGATVQVINTPAGDPF
jgi:hypothetical protein